MVRSKPAPGPEARATLRAAHHYPVRLTVRQSSSGPLQTVHGVSQNLTTTGMRLRVSSKVVIGARCQVAFLQSGTRVTPQTVNATVRNAGRSSDGKFEIGIEFDQPVRIKQPGKL